MEAGEGGAVRPLPADELEHVVRLVLGPLVDACAHPHPPLPQRAREQPLPAHGDEDGAAVEAHLPLHPHAVVLPQHCAEVVDAPPQLQVAGGEAGAVDRVAEPDVPHRGQDVIAGDVRLQVEQRDRQQPQQGAGVAGKR
eukprot:gene3644-biopygen4448